MTIKYMIFMEKEKKTPEKKKFFESLLKECFNQFEQYSLSKHANAMSDMLMRFEKEMDRCEMM